MKIRFRNFWDDFDISNNFFLDYFHYMGQPTEIIERKSELVDLEIESVFPKKHEKIMNLISRKLVSENFYNNGFLENKFRNRKLKKSMARRKLWFTGENIRPPLDQAFDGFLSFDQDSFGGLNCYFPLWYTNAGMLSAPVFNSRVGVEASIQQVLKPRILNSKKEKLAVIFMSNPHPFRLQVVKLLRNFGEVDIFGSFTGRSVKHKIDVSRNYKFTICFENDNYPGYVTEKLWEAYISETVPLYWGNLGKDSPFNTKSFFNLDDYVSMEHYIEFALRADYEKVFQEPLLKSEPETSDFFQFMTRFLEQ